MKTEDVNFLEENLTRINKALFKTLPEKEISRVTEAIHYSVMNGGKRIRPQIILLLCEMLEVEITNENIDLIAAAGELIHCYSLIHDDLPAMDDDDYRRGQLSCHKQFDEATAILAGDAIQPLSLEVLTSLEDPNLEAKTKLEIINLFAKACGPEGMVEGQNRDILAENRVLTEEELDELHYLKTFLVFLSNLYLYFFSSNRHIKRKPQLIFLFLDSVIHLIPLLIKPCFLQEYLYFVLQPCPPDRRLLQKD